MKFRPRSCDLCRRKAATRSDEGRRKSYNFAFSRESLEYVTECKAAREFTTCRGGRLSFSSFTPSGAEANRGNYFCDLMLDNKAYDG